MEYSEDHIALAAEFALGTLDPDERAQVEILMATDNEFAAIVHAWEFRLGVLNQMVGSVEPPPELWERIRTAIGLTGQQAPLVLPETPPPIAPSVLQDFEFALQDLAPGAPPLPAVEPSNVVQLSGRVRAYRNIAAAMTAIAAALLALIGVQVVSPGLLPGLGGKPPVQVVEVTPTPTPVPTPTLVPSAQYVALLQGAAGGPAFILTVDGATRNFTVRKVGAPPIDPSKNYELWLISDKLQNRPRSLGVIGNTDFVARPVLAGYDADVAPHSQPVFIGKLIETVPAVPPTQNR
jgi:anti-sigma-K factor RskA